MLIIKLIGGLLIILSSSLIGILKAKDLEFRTTELREFVCFLQMLETEICYMSNILYDALENCAKGNLNSKVSYIFSDTASLLKNRQLTSNEAWDTAVKANIKNTCLNNEDTEIILKLGNTLGSTDYDGQIKNIRFVINQLEVQISKADSNKEKYQSMYRNLGILSGIAIVITLF